MTPTDRNDTGFLVVGVYKAAELVEVMCALTCAMIVITCNRGFMFRGMREEFIVDYCSLIN